MDYMVITILTMRYVGTIQFVYPFNAFISQTFELAWEIRNFSYSRSRRDVRGRRSSTIHAHAFTTCLSQKNVINNLKKIVYRNLS